MDIWLIFDGYLMDILHSVSALRGFRDDSNVNVRHLIALNSHDKWSQRRPDASVKHITIATTFLHITTTFLQIATTFLQIATSVEVSCYESWYARMTELSFRRVLKRTQNHLGTTSDTEMMISRENVWWIFDWYLMDIWWIFCIVLAL